MTHDKADADVLADPTGDDKGANPDVVDRRNRLQVNNDQPWHGTAGDGGRDRGA
ncbi:hypothetical protein GCM10027610_023550 [Dactylosporangium cerinum]